MVLSFRRIRKGASERSSVLVPPEIKMEDLVPKIWSVYKTQDCNLAIELYTFMYKGLYRRGIDKIDLTPSIIRMCETLAVLFRRDQDENEVIIRSIINESFHSGCEISEEINNEFLYLRSPERLIKVVELVLRPYFLGIHAYIDTRIFPIRTIHDIELIFSRVLE